MLVTSVNPNKKTISPIPKATNLMIINTIINHKIIESIKV